MMLKIALIATAIVAYGSFGVALKKFFRLPAEGLHPKMRWLKLLGTVVAITNIAALGCAHEIDTKFGAAGLALLFLSIALFASALRVNWHDPLAIAYSNVDPHKLVKTGPYRFIRHPFYMSYTIGWFAPAVALAHLWLIPPAIAMFIFYVDAAIVEEYSFAKTHFSEGYREYRQQTGMFFPKLRRSMLSQPPLRKAG